MRSKDKREEINLGKWDQDKLDIIITKTSRINRTGRKIDFISQQFLGTPYREGTLIGNEKTQEVLVMNLSEMDCFTFIDYVEALRLSDSFSSFKNNLIHVRYRSGSVAFDHRNHFFSDWIVFNRDLIEDATAQIGGRKAQSAPKILNVKEDGTLYLPGIKYIERTIDYIPAKALHEPIVRKLKTGDYVGVYTDNPGLDVTHVGIIIKDEGITYLRHASSLHEFRKVIDQEFLPYMAGKPGFLVLRPKIRKMGNRLLAPGNGE